MTRFLLLPLLVTLGAMPCGQARGATLELGATGQFQVQSKGTIETDARIYRSSAPPPAFLVFTKVFRRPVFITTGPVTARLVDPARIDQSGPDPEIVRFDTGGHQDDFLAVRVDGPNLVVDQDGIAITLTAGEPVLGDRTLEELTRLLPEYRRNAARYTPDPAALEKLRRLQQPAELIVFFGSWCPHCEQKVPRLVRVLQDAGGAPIEVRFHGMPQGSSSDPLADEFRVTVLPTGIVRRGSKEIARLVEDDWDAPERRLAATLAGGSAR